MKAADRNLFLQFTANNNKVLILEFIELFVAVPFVSYKSFVRALKLHHTSPPLLISVVQVIDGSVDTMFSVCDKKKFGEIFA